jgi:hypothetical protein
MEATLLLRNVVSLSLHKGIYTYINWPILANSTNNFLASRKKERQMSVVLKTGPHD